MSEVTELSEDEEIVLITVYLKQLMREHEDWKSAEFVRKAKPLLQRLVKYKEDHPDDWAWIYE